MQAIPKDQTSSSFCLAGTFTLALRLVIGWTYFSAFWRRLVLENKLNPDAPGYVGEKFNHFLPNALLIKPFIEFLVSHADLLWWFMLLFTLVEGYLISASNHHLSRPGSGGRTIKFSRRL